MRQIRWTHCCGLKCKLFTTASLSTIQWPVMLQKVFTQNYPVVHRYVILVFMAITSPYCLNYVHCINYSVGVIPFRCTGY